MMKMELMIVPQAPPRGRALGQEITTIGELHAAVIQKRSVISESEFQKWQRPTPAAWIWMQSAGHVYDLINRGLYIYHPPVKINRWKKSK